MVEHNFIKIQTVFKELFSNTSVNTVTMNQTYQLLSIIQNSSFLIGIAVYYFIILKSIINKLKAISINLHTVKILVKIILFELFKKQRKQKAKTVDQFDNKLDICLINS